MKVAISGSNGYLGQHIGGFLVGKGVEVLGLVRPGNERVVELLGMRPIVVDYQSEFSGNLGRVDCFVHLLGSSRQGPGLLFEETNIGTTKRIVAACKKTETERIVYVSGLGVGPNNNESYFLSKYLSEQIIKESGLNYTIFRPSYVVGDGDELTPKLLSQIAGGSVEINGSGLYQMQPIFVDDVSEIFYRTLSLKAVHNRILDLVGPDTISFLGFVQTLARLNEKNPKIIFKDLEKSYQEAMRQSYEMTSLSIEELDVMISDFTSSHEILQEIYDLRLTRLEEALSRSTLGPR